MADLDTRQKRESGFGISLPSMRVLPTPDGSDADGSDERAHLVMNYGGIAAAAPGDPGGRIMGAIAGRGGLAGHGGIAGPSGGLAG